MAVNDTFYGKNFVDRTVGESKKFPPVKIPPGEEVGDVGMAYDSFTIPGVVMATDDVIQMIFLPKGARITEAYLKTESLGAGAVLAVGFLSPEGDLNAPAELFTAFDASAGPVMGILTNIPTAPALMLKIDEDTPNYDAEKGGVMIGVKFSTAGTSTSGKLELAVFSVRD